MYYTNIIDLITFNEDEKAIKDILVDNSDLILDYENKELFFTIRKLVNNIESDQDRNIIKLYFGFDSDINYTKKELAKKFNLTEPAIRKIINRNVDKKNNYID